MASSKAAIVTGGASGIGLATCRKLASRGVNVLIADFQDGNASKLIAELESTFGIRAVFKRVDVSNEADVKQMVEMAVATFGRVDYAVNCAGICENIWAEEQSISTDLVDRTYAINQRGLWLCQKYEALQMSKQSPSKLSFSPASDFPIPEQRGSIVNVASLSGHFGMGLAAYTPTKHAVLGITRNGALFYGPSGIRCNALCPGSTTTPMLEKSVGLAGVAGSKESREDPVVQGIPLRRKGFAEEQANVIYFLLSDESSYVNGASILVDGGHHAVK